MTGAWLGLFVAAGLWLVLGGLARLRRATLVEQLQPYLLDVLPPASGRRTARPQASPRPAEVRRFCAELVRRLAVRLDRLVGGRPAVEARLDQLGGGTVERLRVEQVVWGGAGVGAVVGVGLLRAAVGARPDPLLLLVMAAAAGTAGVLARDRRLTRAVLRRRARMQAELPAVAELVALAVAAGEGPVGALRRVSVLCPGVLGAEIGRTLAEVRAGAAVTVALRGLAARHDLVALRRFVDGVVVALDRGTPLAQVLRAQAVDVRAQARHDLIESAARREVAMVLPVVLLVLPVSVVFALFPGFWGLSLNA